MIEKPYTYIIRRRNEITLPTTDRTNHSNDLEAVLLIFIVPLLSGRPGNAVVRKVLLVLFLSVMKSLPSCSGRAFSTPEDRQGCRCRCPCRARSLWCGLYRFHFSEPHPFVKGPDVFCYDLPQIVPFVNGLLHAASLVCYRPGFSRGRMVPESDIIDTRQRQ